MLCYMARGDKGTDGMKVAKQLTLISGAIRVGPVSSATSPLGVDEGGRKSESEI